MNILWYYYGVDSKDEVLNIGRIVDHMIKLLHYAVLKIVWC